MIVIDFDQVRQQLTILNTELDEVNALMRLVEKRKSLFESSPISNIECLRRDQEFLEAEKNRINKRILYLSEILDGFTNAKGYSKGQLDDAVNALKAATDY